jgi:hypothetical protein
MAADKEAKPGRIHPGDPVMVRSFREILSTLDRAGTFEGLPFLPEMVKYCGRTFTVRRRVNKLIQEGAGAGMRRITHAVLLDGPVCDGKAHGYCERCCFPLWKTAWLRVADEESLRIRDNCAEGSWTSSRQGEAHLAYGKVCQVTALGSATRPLPLWDPRYHLWDITSRVYSPYLGYLLGGLYRNLLKRPIVKLSRRRAAPHDQIESVGLDLQSGDLVEVKSAEEIRATLNSKGKSRGLYFMPGMWEYCGRRLRVVQPVNRMMSESTGDMRSLAQTVILEGATCSGRAHSGCQRGCYLFWKDTWLRRVSQTPRRTPHTFS